MGSRWNASIGRMIAVVLVGIVISGCASNPSQPAASAPARSARVFCERPVEHEISTSLGITPERVVRSGRTDHAYRCRYIYPEGAIALSVRGFADQAAAEKYFDELGRRRGRRPEVPQLGEDLHAFVTTDGSMIVRNHRDVLDVDVSALPERFGEPPQPRSIIALAVAVTILGHWSPG